MAKRLRNACDTNVVTMSSRNLDSRNRRIQMSDIVTKAHVLTSTRVEKQAIEATVTHSYGATPGEVDRLIHDWCDVSEPCFGD